MRYIARWWRDGAKPLATEYWHVLSWREMQSKILELADATKAERIEVRDESGQLVAYYPQAMRER